MTDLEATYDLKTHQWVPQCPYGDVCSGCDAAGQCVRGRLYERYTLQALRDCKDILTDWLADLETVDALSSHDEYIQIGARWSEGNYAERFAEAMKTRVTHGRHCPCSACARENWALITAPCGMHGDDCPATYVPIGPGAKEARALHAFLHGWREGGVDRIFGCCSEHGNYELPSAAVEAGLIDRKCPACVPLMP